MQTRIKPALLQTAEGERANRILRSCVHCGFCNATCPTYQLLGDELDGPRGRIYLIKQMLEGATAGRQTQQHLDRCLTCRNCESTCPSGVHYSQLLNIGREMANRQVPRPLYEMVLHWVLRRFFLNRFLFTTSLRLGQLCRPLLGKSLRRHIPPRQDWRYPPARHIHARKVLLIPGCVQPTLTPNTDLAARLILDKLSITCLSVSAAGCCGSLSHHLNARSEALNIMRQNIDHWWPMLESGEVEAITMTASGCGVAIKEYAQLLADDPAYAEKAQQVSALYKDPIELIMQEVNEQPDQLQTLVAPKKASIAFHPPCTLQHGMQIKGQVEALLKTLGYELLPFQDSHLCCGSAGTYSITQQTLSRQLRDNKLKHILSHAPEMIITANIGCQLHLQSGTDTPVKHWLELLAEDSEDSPV